jgi:hypothetical protein
MLTRILEIARTAYVALPTILDFILGPCGREYGVGPVRKLDLFLQFLRNTNAPGAATMVGEHVTLAKALLSVPKQLEGCVAEFGCYKGLSTASLSLVCALTGRRLVVFDSFEGLPATNETIRHFNGREIRYEGGLFAGTLAEVRANVTRYGDISVCEFVKGFFSATLPLRPPEEYVMIFEDADLPSSVIDVLRHAWGRLQPGCRYFTHEARDREVVELFYHPALWQNPQDVAPGLVGAGLGLPLGREGSCLGYCEKS